MSEREEAFWEIVFTIIVPIIVALMPLAIVFAKAEAAEPKTYDTKVVLVEQYYNDDLELIDVFEEYNGDALVSYFDYGADKWLDEVMIFDGNGDSWEEPYTISDDTFVGDVFTATVDTKNTTDKSDDTLTIKKYMGAIVPTNINN